MIIRGSLSVVIAVITLFVPEVKAFWRIPISYPAGGTSGRFYRCLKSSSSTSSIDDNESADAAFAGAPGETQYFLAIKTYTNITQVNREEWNGLLRPDESPFLEYDWLYCLEESRCAIPETGWNPLHLTIRMQTGKNDEVFKDDEGEIVAAAPCYIKTHSMGEFIFDNAWADAAYRSGIEYYPKIICAVPFTPASGSRILLKDGLSKPVKDEIRKMLGIFLNNVAEDNKFSSVHVNFCDDDEVKALNGAGYMHRKSMQFHWRNRNAEKGNVPYTSFDDYLAAFRSKRRQKIKKERRSVYHRGIILEVLRGDQIHDSLFDDDVIFNIYVSTIEKLYYGRQYLNEKFFRMLKDCFRQHICLVLAKRESSGEIVAGTFNVVKAGRFYGRYWGCFEDIKNLHFEACYYKAIEYCIEEGLRTMEPGAGGDSFKYMRGFDPVEINSMHTVIHLGLRAAVADFLAFERRQVANTADYLTEKSVVRARDSSSSSTGLEEEGQEAEIGKKATE